MSVPPQQQRRFVYPTAPKNGMGVSSLVLGIIGCIAAFVPFLFWIAFVLAVLGLIFGPVGIARARQGTATNLGVAVAGTILSGVALVLAFGALTLTAALFA